MGAPVSRWISPVIVSWAAVFVTSLAHADPLTEDECSIISSSGGKPPVIGKVSGLSILNWRPEQHFKIVPPEGMTIHGVVCWRSEARLAKNDFVPVEAGFPFYVKTETGDEKLDRTLVLELTGGSYRARLASGPDPSEEEKSELRVLVAEYQARHEAQSQVESNPTPPEAGQAEHLSPNAPKDRPYALKDTRGFDEQIAPYVAQALQTYPDAKARFLKGLPRGNVFFAVTRIHDDKGRFEQAFIRVRSIRDGIITGAISSQLSLVKGYSTGGSYQFKESELVDWVIARPDGGEEGNFVGKFLDTRKSGDPRS
jgi:hypothetical protein